MNAPGPDASREPAVRIGRLNGAWGVSGWVKVFSYTDPPENIFSYQPWQADGSPGLLRVLITAEEIAVVVHCLCQSSPRRARISLEYCTPFSQRRTGRG